MKNTALILISFFLACAAASCVIRTSPSTPSGWYTPTFTATATVTMTPTIMQNVVITAGVGTIEYCSEDGISWTCFPMNPGFSVKISSKSTPVRDAAVNINGTPLNYGSDNGIYGVYTCPSFTAASYGLTINCGGNIYTASAAYPSCSSSFWFSSPNSLAWSSDGNYNWLAVSEGSMTYSASNFTVSPHVIPASAYPDAGGYYQVVLSLENRVALSGMAPGDTGYFSVARQNIWTFTK